MKRGSACAKDKRVREGWSGERRLSCALFSARGRRCRLPFFSFFLFFTLLPSTPPHRPLLSFSPPSASVLNYSWPPLTLDSGGSSGNCASSIFTSPDSSFTFLASVRLNRNCFPPFLLYAPCFDRIISLIAIIDKQVPRKRIAIFIIRWMFDEIHLEVHFIDFFILERPNSKNLRMLVILEAADWKYFFLPSSLSLSSSRSSLPSVFPVNNGRKVSQTLPKRLRTGVPFETKGRSSRRKSPVEGGGESSSFSSLPYFPTPLR